MLPTEVFFEISIFLDLKSLFNLCISRKDLYQNIFQHQERRKILFYYLYKDKVQNGPWMGKNTLELIKKNQFTENWFQLYLSNFGKLYQVKTKKIFNDFGDEILSSSWSKDGKFLALGSKDGILEIHEFLPQENTFKRLYHLKKPKIQISFLRFDDSGEFLIVQYLFLIPETKILNLKTMKVIDIKNSSYTCPPYWYSNEEIVYVKDTGVSINNYQINFYNYKEQKDTSAISIYFTPEYNFGIENLLLSHGKTFFLFVTGTSLKGNKNRNTIKMVKISEKKDFNVQDLPSLNLGTIRLSDYVLTKDDKNILVNYRFVDRISNSHSLDFDLDLINIETGSTLMKFQSHKGLKGQPPFFITPYIDDDFVLCGGQDYHIYIWSRKYGHLIRKIEHHKGPVSIVSWHPTSYGFTSVCDDKTAVYWSL